MVEWNRRCESCHHWQADADGASSGGCFWSVPPIVSKLIDMLKSEPALHIDYKAALFDSGAPTTHANYGCGSWSERLPQQQPRQQTSVE